MRRYWFLHLLLILLAVAAPAGALLYLDAQAAVAASETQAEQRLRGAEGLLSAALDRAAEARLGQVIAVAAKLSVRDSLSRLESSRSKEAEAEALQAELKALAPAGGFALLVDAEGVVRASSPATTPAGVAVPAHPLFQRARAGEATLGRWQPGVLAAVAPVAQEGRAAGAVIIGAAPDKAQLERLAKLTGAGLSFVQGKQVVLSTLPEAEAKLLAAAQLPKLSGTRAEPLPGLGPLPLFLDRKLSGRAWHTGEVTEASGLAQRWLVSVPVGGALAGLVARQKLILLIALGAALVVLLFGLIQSRVFVRPLSKIEDHLSKVAQGSGDMELPEVRVSGPFRRVVRLINMIVQKGQRAGGGSTVPAAELSRLGSTPAPIPSAIPSAVDGLSLTPAPEPADIIPSADLLKLGTPSSGIDAFAPLESAAAAVPPNDEHAAAIADAINSLNEAESTSGAVSSIPPRVRSAADIRGTPMGEEPGPRGGGSLSEEGSRSPSDSGMFGVGDDPDHREKTVVATVSPDLLARSADGAGLEDHPPTLTQARAPQFDDGIDDADRAHFREVYDRFIDMRRRCGENTGDLSYDRFAQKLMKNRAALIEKYACRTVRFQVHEKNGKAALKATPVRSKS